MSRSPVSNENIERVLKLFENNPYLSARQNGIVLSSSLLNQITRCHPYQIRDRQRSTENDFQRRLNFSSWIIRMCGYNKFLTNIFIGDEACVSMHGIVNTYNIAMYAQKGNKPDFTFKINNSHQKVTAGVECVAVVFC